MNSLRNKYIPVKIPKASEKKKVRLISEELLMGIDEELATYNEIVKDFNENYQLAIAFCLMQGWLDHMRTLPTNQLCNPDGSPLEITKNVANFLNDFDKFQNSSTLA